MSSLEELEKTAQELGEQVRALKAKGEDPGESLKKLLETKEMIAKITGKSASSSSKGGNVAAEKKAEAQKKTSEKAEAKAKKAEELAARKAENEAKKKTKTKDKEEAYVDTTPAGEKKDMTRDMQNEYHPAAVEQAWYAWWEKKGFFHADNAHKKGKGKTFVMVIPPPNVTGSLHIGHALTNSIEDTITRWHRMRGDETLWVPGCDHAGIATQTVVEKMIMAKEKKTRHDYGREAFVNKVWEWKEEYGGKIYHQLRKLGSSLDWDREAFTMNEKLSRAVQEAFIRMANMGLIYRATRLVNWCPKLNSAISDIEVDYINIENRTARSVPNHKNKVDFGYLTSFAYKVEGSDEEIVVATTRLETMLGDTAVAVHPDDPRYKHLHGKKLVHPFVDRKIPIITDGTLVDMAFGTGAVKVTPAHDPNDFLCGQRHNLQMITIFTEGGAMNENAGEFKGLMRFDARLKVLEAIKAKGLYRGEQNNPMRLGVCSRTGDIIEPMLKPQWYVDCKEMAAKAAAAVRNKELKLIPDFHESTWYAFLDNSRDWCISRQLWWGHRIPAFLVTIEGRPAPNDIDMSSWIVAHDETEARKLAAAKFGVPETQISLSQDPDVLDTWFSSGLFPFSVFGWPDNTPDMEAFFPTSLLETGSDILFFWVARMVMMSLTLTGKLPFSEVFLHAIVRDAHGRKMSKSLGNVIDPLDVITGISLDELNKRLEQTTNLDPSELERAKLGQAADYPLGIPECGTDAMRFALVAYSTQGRSINLDINRVVGYRQFGNKIWNAVRFAMMSMGKDFKAPLITALDGTESIIDRWILDRLDFAIAETNSGFETYDFAKATNAIYNFWLYELCDIYLEASKPVFRSDDSNPAKSKARAVLYTCVDQALRLIHPFMPFVSEELWQRLTNPGSDASIMVAEYPESRASMRTANADAGMKTAMEIVRLLRVLRTEYNLSKQRPEVQIMCTTADASALVKAHAEIIATLSAAANIVVVGAAPTDKGFALQVVNEDITIFMDCKGLVNKDAELKRLQENLDLTKSRLETLTQKMNAPGYDKVPEKIRSDNDTRHAALTKELEVLLKSIEDMKLLP